MNEIQTHQPDIHYEKAPVLFSNYQSLKEQALMIAESVSSVQVTADTVASAKKMLAEVRKSVKALDAKRIAVKKEILEDYQVFEDQCNELKKIVDDADSVVRRQVRELEECERLAKKARIREIWNRRIGMYDCEYFPDLFDRWIRSDHLNKTKSLNVIEKEMVEFLESVQKDIDAIDHMPERDQIMAVYMRTLNLGDSISQVQQKKEDEKLVSESIGSEEKAVFVVRGKKDILLTETLLKNNEINFERR